MNTFTTKRIVQPLDVAVAQFRATVAEAELATLTGIAEGLASSLSRPREAILDELVALRALNLPLAAAFDMVRAGMSATELHATMAEFEDKLDALNEELKAEVAAGRLTHGAAIVVYAERSDKLMIEFFQAGAAKVVAGILSRVLNPPTA